MAESESKALKTTWTPEPKSDADDLADRQATARQKQARDELTVRVHGDSKLAAKPTTTAQLSPNKRAHSSRLENRFDRIRSIPGTFAEYCTRADNMRPPLGTRTEWQAGGCPRSLTEARNRPNWRRKVYDEWWSVRHPRPSK